MERDVPRGERAARHHCRLYANRTPLRKDAAWSHDDAPAFHASGGCNASVPLLLHVNPWDSRGPEEKPGSENSTPRTHRIFA